MVDAGYRADGSGLIQLYIGAVTAGIDQHLAAAFAGVLRGIGPAQDDEGIMLVAGGAPA